MEKNYLSALEDSHASLTKKLSIVEKNLSNFFSSNSSSKQEILSKMKKDLKNMKPDFGLMKNDIMSLQKSENKAIWKEKYSSLKAQKEKLENKIENLQIEGNNNKNDEDDYMDINKKIDLEKLSSEQVMKRGNKILDEDDKSLENMIKTLSKGRGMIQDTNIELYKQMEAMDKIHEGLNEMDGSLNRAKKNISYMNKIA